MRALWFKLQKTLQARVSLFLNRRLWCGSVWFWRRKQLHSSVFTITMHRPEDCDTFEFSDKEFIYTTNTWAADSSFELSRFDLELRQRWDKAMKEGAFRYDIDQITTRIIDGPKHYVAQLNLLRAKERRKPQDIRSISQSFNPKQFNFTWVGPQEVVFNLKHVQLDSNCSDAKTETQKSSDQPPSNDNDKTAPVSNGVAESSRQESSEERHTLVINVSPMEYGHCLLIPQIDSCLPQIVTETSVNVALQTLLLSQHRGYVLGFNSLCAFASVNHLHYHAYYLEHELIVQYCPVTHLVDDLYEMTTMPVPGFAFQLHGSTLPEISRKVFKVSSYFQDGNIAYNLFICRGVIFGDKQDSTNTTIRVYIWPRRKFIGTKSAEEFNVASIELGGHLPIRELDGYHSLTEESVDAIIADSQLPTDDYQQIKKDIMAIFTPVNSQ